MMFNTCLHVSESESTSGKGLIGSVFVEVRAGTYSRWTTRSLNKIGPTTDLAARV